MDNLNSNTVNDLRIKVRKLIALYENTESQNVQLLKENENLKKQLKQKDIEIANFKEKYSNMQLAKSIASVESNHDAKIKINRIVREIDRCISLLNK